MPDWTIQAAAMQPNRPRSRIAAVDAWLLLM
jgi:hypothetical protein